jgi:hypothetical protein
MKAAGSWQKAAIAAKNAAPAFILVCSVTSFTSRTSAGIGVSYVARISSSVNAGGLIREAQSQVPAASTAKIAEPN